MHFCNLHKYPELLNTKDLINIGLYPTPEAAYFARKKGLGPCFIKVGRRVFYPKSEVIKFLSNNLYKRASNVLNREQRHHA